MLNLAMTPSPQTIPSTIERYNTFADWMFYDVTNLTRAEFNFLSTSSFQEGSILVVDPMSNSKDIGIRKYMTHKDMVTNNYVNHDANRPKPKSKVADFAIAGVGSSDVGAAALARTRANQLGKPVGAIVAGYGISDILQEALGGWFFFGNSNRIQAFVDMYCSYLPNSVFSNFQIEGKGEDLIVNGYPNDTRTLLSLLNDPKRQINSVISHSKGCLSLAFALNDIADSSDAEEFKKIKDIEIVTVGAVCKFPNELTRVRQYLGSLDWFGGMNSSMSVSKKSVPNAWHHLNTQIPFHMNLEDVLSGKFD